MTVVCIYRAQPLNGRGGEPTIIRLAEQIPDVGHGGDVLARAKALYAGEGERLASALWNSLPGGTFDALLGEMLALKASLFRVGYGGGGGDRLPVDPRTAVRQAINELLTAQPHDGHAGPVPTEWESSSAFVVVEEWVERIARRLEGRGAPS